MKRTSSTWTLAIAATAAVAMSATPPLRAELLEKTKKVGGTTVHYKLSLIHISEPTRPY